MLHNTRVSPEAMEGIRLAVMAVFFILVGIGIGYGMALNGGM